jgi:hypothetical protein
VNNDEHISQIDWYNRFRDSDYERRHSSSYNVRYAHVLDMNIVFSLQNGPYCKPRRRRMHFGTNTLHNDCVKLIHGKLANWQRSHVRGFEIPNSFSPIPSTTRPIPPPLSPVQNKSKTIILPGGKDAHDRPAWDPDLAWLMEGVFLLSFHYYHNGY